MHHVVFLPVEVQGSAVALLNVTFCNDFRLQNDVLQCFNLKDVLVLFIAVEWKT